MSGDDGSQGSNRARPEACGGEDAQGGCIRSNGVDRDDADRTSAAVAMERVSRREHGDVGGDVRAFRVSLSVAVMGVLAVHRIWAGHSHGSVNCSDNCVGDRNAVLRSFRRAACASIMMQNYVRWVYIKRVVPREGKEETKRSSNASTEMENPSRDADMAEMGLL